MLNLRPSLDRHISSRVYLSHTSPVTPTPMKTTIITNLVELEAFISKAKSSGVGAEAPVFFMASTLKARRIELGLTQQQLADRLGVKQGNVSQIENGEKGMSIPMLLRYCKALKLELTFTTKD